MEPRSRASSCVLLSAWRSSSLCARHSIGPQRPSPMARQFGKIHGEMCCIETPRVNLDRRTCVTGTGNNAYVDTSKLRARIGEKNLRQRICKHYQPFHSDGVIQLLPAPQLIALLIASSFATKSAFHLRHPKSFIWAWLFLSRGRLGSASLLYLPCLLRECLECPRTVFLMASRKSSKRRRRRRMVQYR